MLTRTGVRAIATAVLALLVTAPGSVATWGVHGSVEPSTSWDVRSLMFDDPPTAPGRVYFNVVENEGATGVNPNAQPTTRVGAHQPSYGAYLGEWVDCNRDGYIGMADGAVLEYRSELLFDTFSCPPGLENNKDGWAYELRWIAPASSAPHPGTDTYVVPRLLDDPEALVWGDLGEPGATPERGTCAVAPIPRGTTSSTGGLVRYADCFGGRMVEATVRGNDPTGALLDQHAPLSTFGDPETGQTGMLEKESGRPAFTTWDCSEPQAIEVGDPTGGSLSGVVLDSPSPLLNGKKGVEGVAEVVVFQREGDGKARFRASFTENGSYAYFPSPAPAVDPDGSLYDGANETEFGIVEHCDPHRDAVPDFKQSTLLQAYPEPEADHSGVDLAEGRRRSDFVFDFKHNVWSNQESGTITQGAIGAPAIGDVFGHAMPQDGGVAIARFTGGGFGPGWDAQLVDTVPAQVGIREDLEVSAARYVTFYAHVGDAITDRGIATPGGSSVYGAEACGGAEDGLVNGWDCDPDHWWTPPYSGEMPRNPNSGVGIGVKPGQDYELRDVDCADDTVLTLGPSNVYADGACA